MTRKVSLIAALSLLGLLPGCYGSANGTVSGLSLNVQDAIFFLIKDDNGATQAAAVVMADQPNLCDALKANRQPKGATSLTMGLFNLKVEGANVTFLAPDVGDYTVNPAPTSSGMYASVTFSKQDSNCTDTLNSTATGGKSGSLKVSSLNAAANGSLAATFDFTIGTQNDSLKGNINARFCDVTKLQTNPNCQ